MRLSLEVPRACQSQDTGEIGGLTVSAELLRNRLIQPPGCCDVKRVLRVGDQILMPLAGRGLDDKRRSEREVGSRSVALDP